jgi:hypothetical protein
MMQPFNIQKLSTQVNRCWIIGFSLLASQNAMAIDIGPFTITGFAKGEVSSASNQCSDCQLIPGEGRHRPWADTLVSGKPYGTKGSEVTLFQPYIGTQEFDLGSGFKAKGLLSQRWRDGKQDIDGIWYEKNATLSHENYGSIQVGAFPTRSWSLADYPYGTSIGVADAWGSSGAGYGLLTQAVRIGLPLMDVNEGDLHIEATFDQGAKGFTVHKPSFVEIYAKYTKGPLTLDVIAQHAKNGLPSAWGHGPFAGVTVDPANDLASGQGNKQSIAMMMVQYQWDAKTTVLAGVRHNKWSGNKANYVKWTPQGDIWNDFFNIGCAGTGNCLTEPGYSASSTDLSLGLVYKWMPNWTINTGMVYLGKAATKNPVERGQSNTMLLNTVGIGYEIQPGFSVYGFAGMVNFGKKGLAPLSMPGHAAFTGVDSRVAKSGNWLGAGLVYTF